LRLAAENRTRPRVGEITGTGEGKGGNWPGPRAGRRIFPGGALQMLYWQGPQEETGSMKGFETVKIAVLGALIFIAMLLR